MHRKAGLLTVFGLKSVFFACIFFLKSVYLPLKKGLKSVNYVA